MTKRHRKAGTDPVNHYITTSGRQFSIKQADIDDAKEIHGIDLVKEVTEMLEETHTKEQNED